MSIMLVLKISTALKLTGRLLSENHNEVLHEKPHYPNLEVTFLEITFLEIT
jgi:hypothetical protein